MKDIIICVFIIVALIVVAIPLFMIKRKEVDSSGFGSSTYITTPYSWIAMMLVIFAIGMSIAVAVQYEKEMKVQSDILSVQEEIDTLNVLLENEEDEIKRENIIALINSKTEKIREYQK